jgi:hypothetical protein
MRHRGTSTAPSIRLRAGAAVGARRRALRRSLQRQGTPALYLALDVLTAIREANQVGSLQPTTLVA